MRENVVLFRSLLPNEIERLVSAAQRRTYAAGETIFRESDPGGDLFLVEEGTIEIRVKGEGEVVQLVAVGPGETIGEVSLMDEGPRSADAVALGPVAVLFWPNKSLQTLFEKEPRIGYVLAANIGRIVATRVRGANALLLYRTAARKG